MIKERPILFSTQMVKAILEGRKTQTRRIIKSDKAQLRQKVCRESSCFPHEFFENWMFYDSYDLDESGRESNCISDRNVIKCPFGKEGDRLWIRETFCYAWNEDDHICDKDGNPVWDAKDAHIYYAASETNVDGKWKPSVHMPRWASRILLEITNIRVERLHDISKEDAIAEGFDYSTHPSAIEMGYAIGARTNFRFAWEKIYGQNEWNQNPWVWCITFKVIEGGAA